MHRSSFSNLGWFLYLRFPWPEYSWLSITTSSYYISATQCITLHFLCIQKYFYCCFYDIENELQLLLNYSELTIGPFWEYMQNTEGNTVWQISVQDRRFMNNFLTLVSLERGWLRSRRRILCNYSGNSVLLFFSPFPFTLLLRENLNTEESDVITHIWDLLLKWHIASAALILLHSRQQTKRRDLKQNLTHEILYIFSVAKTWQWWFQDFLYPLCQLLPFFFIMYKLLILLVLLVQKTHCD